MRISKIDGIKVTDYNRTKHRIGYQDQPNHIRWYVSDLPGHVGTVRAKQGSERNSDWGWTTKETQAILLSPYWQRRFTAFLNRDANRTGGLR